MRKTLIIAEAGVNHNGDIEIAKKLIDAAAEAGVDYVKFQTFKATNLVSKVARKAEYQIQNHIGKAEESQLEMLQKLQLSEADHYTLISYCQEKNIRFFSTAFDLDSLDLLKKLGLTLFKIPSGEITNLPYLRKISQIADEIILSTGMSTIDEIEQAVAVLRKNSDTKITVLHCNTEYPTPFGDVNLLAMNAIKDSIGVEVGYSDHTLGIEVPIAAVALGATVIEKHFTLDRTMPGPDHAASLEPKELTAMVKAIRNIEKALGTSIKVPSESESKNISIVRKCIVALKPIAKDEIFSEDNLTVKRAGIGISPMKWDEIIGRKAVKDFLPDEVIFI
ncbi:N-acetylneuraminate synthase [Mucilaginibacter calamicampi]|uniref:N-acetylneuraminate synthase n=1 Tax=Mucilaginibacter calamicampi TaxID=1302352 RepID=A0ABW2YYW7_9SPHI